VVPRVVLGDSRIRRLALCAEIELSTSFGVNGLLIVCGVVGVRPQGAVAVLVGVEPP
jgi:hypothetical protein